MMSSYPIHRIQSDGNWHITTSLGPAHAAARGSVVTVGLKDPTRNARERCTIRSRVNLYPVISFDLNLYGGRSNDSLAINSDWRHQIVHFVVWMFSTIRSVHVRYLVDRRR